MVEIHNDSIKYLQYQLHIRTSAVRQREKSNYSLILQVYIQSKIVTQVPKHGGYIN
jgi:hypothetical protein